MAQQNIGIRVGKPEIDSVVVVGCSLTGVDIVISVDGVGSFTITPSQLGTDHTPDQAGFVGNVTITGLSAYTKYTYTATQGNNSVSGYFWTAPDADDDFILMPITCDNNTSLSGSASGGYPQVRAIAEANPNKAVYFAHIDDHYGYPDLNQVDDGGIYVTSGGNAAHNTALVFDYALGVFAAFGLYGSANAYCTWGQDADRIWCMQNIPVLPQWGDHDCGVNEMGWAVDPTDNTGTPSPLTQFTNAKAVWDAFLLPLQGAAISTGTNAWEHTLGCIKLIAPDGITNGSGDGTGTTKPTGDVYGSTQVTDIINSCDDSIPFKMLLMQYGIRYKLDPPTAQSSGAQNPIGGNEGFTTPIAAHADYAQMMTDVGGLMTKSSCNGRSGVLIAVHGDYHVAEVARNANTQGTNDEWFYSINVGTINGSVNFNTAPLTAGDSADGSVIEYIEGTLGNSNWWVVPFYVYGSRDIKEIEVNFMDKNGATLWNKKFTERSMNDAIDVYFNVNANGSGSDVGGLGL